MKFCESCGESDSSTLLATIQGIRVLCEPCFFAGNTGNGMHVAQLFHAKERLAALRNEDSMAQSWRDERI